MSIIPNVLVTDGDGVSRVYDIYSTLVNDRNIFITGEIDEETSSLIIAQLLYMNSDSSTRPICLYINSKGGEALHGLAIVDVIKSLHAPVYTYCIGSCYGTAALIFSSGTREYRFLYPHSKINIQGAPKSSDHIQKNNHPECRFSESLSCDFCKVIADNSMKEVKRVCSDFKNENWLTANEAVEYGLADRIVHVR